MSGSLVLPLLVPLAFGAALVFCASQPIALQRTLGLTSAVVQLALGVMLVWASTGDQPIVYYLGDWPAPYGIVLVLDRLSAAMVLLGALLAVATLVYACEGDDERGAYFHPLFQFQLLGINGAFLTGDLFNLFVFFEILLIASYCLLVHGGGPRRAHAGLQFVVLNLTGSIVFLVALGVIYAAAGTMNMAHLARVVAEAPPEHAGLLRTAGLLLLLVFGFKAAVLPLGFWLPAAYSAATAPVAALFAILTKVGVYAIMRVHTLVFGDDAGVAASVAMPWLVPFALATVAIGTLGVVASRELRRLVANLVVVSVGTLLAAVGLFTAGGLAAATFYLIHSTLVAAGLFLLADVIALERGGAGDDLARPHATARPALLGTLFFAGAVAMAGLPPLSGFAGKIFILRAAAAEPSAVWFWGVVLVSGVFVVVSLARAGSAVFWRTGETVPGAARAGPYRIAAAGGLIAASGVIMVLGGPISGYATATAAQLGAPLVYAERVLGNASVRRTADEWREME